MRYLLFISFLLLSNHLFSQKAPNDSPYDGFIKRFNEKLDTAVWLCKYDHIAWITTDSVYETPKHEQQKLGSEWFCFEKDNLWHAVYGKFKNDKYELAYHYTVDTLGKVSRIYEEVDTILSHSYSRSLQNSMKEYLNRNDSIQVRFNSYVKSHKDKSITVWLLPAFTQDAIAVYGGEFSYTFDSTGRNLISRNEYLGTYMGIKPGNDRKKEFWLDYENLEEPTVGGIFFVWYYKSYFERIILATKKFKSTVFHENHKNYNWVHASMEK